MSLADSWRPGKISLIPGFGRGGATDAIKVISDYNKITLRYSCNVTFALISNPPTLFRPNPGRVDPMSPAWNVTRKPLAAGWQTTTGEYFYTVNVHLSSKRDSSSAHGDARPPINGHVERRTEQVHIVAVSNHRLSWGSLSDSRVIQNSQDFVETILVKDVNASIIVAGDMNEFVQTRSAFRHLNNLLTDINESSGVNAVERYTYVYDQNTQEIDQIFISEAIVRRGTEVEHVHVNTWAQSYSGRASDHDPSVAKLWVCDPPLNENGTCAGIRLTIWSLRLDNL